MLNIYGEKTGRFCDGINRRDVLKIGGLALGGMSLTDILAAEAQAGIKSSHKAVIMVFLAGGAPHQDMFDLKMDAPAEIRGEFKPIKTNVPGLDICEHMPKMAAMMDKFAVIRSLVGAAGEHAAEVCLSGYSEQQAAQKKAPAVGSVLSRVYGPVERTIPPYVSLSGKMGHMPWSAVGRPGWLGMAHAPVQPDGQVMKDMTLKDVSLSRLADRRRMLEAVDHFRKQVDARVSGQDAITQQAFDILTSRKFVEALDVTKEDPKVRAKYGYGSPQNVDDGGPCWNDQLVVARRLVEAGARCVTLTYGRWDYHGNNFGQCRERLPKLDTALSALVQDLHDRGMDKDVSVIAWGEMGRTPRINKDGGRDHWPQVSAAVLAGGGMRTGQVIGSTNRLGEVADERPVHYHEVFSTLYHCLGLDIRNQSIIDAEDRPQFILDRAEPLRELI